MPSLTRYRAIVAAIVIAAVATLVAGVLVYLAIFRPKVDKPAQVDAIVVMAGADDYRYQHAKNLAVAGVSDHLIVIVPPRAGEPYASRLADYCEHPVGETDDGRLIAVDCIAPTSDSTEGDVAAAMGILRANNAKSVLAVTYWGHVSRVRIYFEQCFEGAVYVSDTPDPVDASRRYALFHETGGYVKAFFKPAC